MERQIEHQTPNRMSLLCHASTLFIFIRQKYTSDMVTISAAKHQRSDKFLKIKYKAL